CAPATSGDERPTGKAGLLCDLLDQRELVLGRHLLGDGELGLRLLEAGDRHALRSCGQRVHAGLERLGRSLATLASGERLAAIQERNGELVEVQLLAGLEAAGDVRGGDEGQG